MIVFDDMSTDMFSNKKLNPIVTELFIRGRKLNIYLVFITQFYFVALKNVKVNSTHYFVMKIPNKKKLQQFPFNQSLDIEFQDFVNLYKKWTATLNYFLVIDSTLASNNSSHYRKNLSARMWKIIMTSDEKIREKKLQYNINREAAKISALSLRKIDELLTSEKILPSDQSRIIEQVKFTYSLSICKTNKNTWRASNKTIWNFKSFKIRWKRRTKINWRTFPKKENK